MVLWLVRRICPQGQGVARGTIELLQILQTDECESYGIELIPHIEVLLWLLDLQVVPARSAQA